MVATTAGLVERDAELDLVCAALADPDGQIVFIDGEAGSGKTELIRAAIAAQRSDDVLVLHGMCEQLDIPVAFAPLFEIRDLLPSDLAGAITDGTERLTVYADVLSLLRDQPVALIIDDLQWADAATIGLLRYLGRRLHDTSACLVLAFRTDDLPGADDVADLLAELGSSATRVPLLPLTTRGIERLADDPAVDAAALRDVTGGNAFFVVEVLREGRGTIPRTVDDAVLARLRHLSLGAQRLVEAVSLCPDGLPIETAVHLSSDASVHLDDACARGLIVIDRDRVRCCHDIVRSSVERSIAPLRRRALHAQLLELLEPIAGDARSLAGLAMHSAGAGDAHRAVEYSLRAADDALRAGTHRQAADHLVRALRFRSALTDEELDELLCRAVTELDLVGDHDLARQFAEDRLARAFDDETRADSLAQLGDCALRIGDCESGLRYAEESLALTPTSSSTGRAIASRVKARAMMNHGDWRNCAAQSLVAVDEARKSESSELEALALVTAGTAHAPFAGDVGFDMLRNAFRLAADHEHHDAAATAINNLGSSLTWAFRVLEARSAFADGIAYAVAHELDAWHLSMRSGSALNELRAGDWVASRQFLAAPIGASSCWGSQGEARSVAALLEARTTGEAASDVADSLRLLDIADSPWDRVFSAALACEAAWHGCLDRSEALERYERAMESNALTADPWGAGAIVFWSTRLGFPLTPTPDTLPDPIVAELDGDHVGAAQEWEHLGCAFEAALARAGAGDPPIEAITDTLRSLGATATLGVIRSDLRARGVRVGSTSATRHPSGLTPRQLDVLALLAEGMSNAEISGGLYISEKTAGHHVSAILTAFGVASRGAAVAHARRNGWVPDPAVTS